MSLRSRSRNRSERFFIAWHTPPLKCAGNAETLERRAPCSTLTLALNPKSKQQLVCREFINKTRKRRGDSILFRFFDGHAKNHHNNGHSVIIFGSIDERGARNRQKLFFLHSFLSFLLEHLFMGAGEKSVFVNIRSAALRHRNGLATRLTPHSITANEVIPHLRRCDQKFYLFSLHKFCPHLHQLCIHRIETFRLLRNTAHPPQQTHLNVGCL